MRYVNYLTALIVLVIACTGLGCGPREGGSEGGGSASQLADASSLPSEDVEPFTHEELPSIEGNEMHEAHFAAGNKCGECHLSDQPMPVSTAHEVCRECHPGQEVSKPVWESHCLSCHHFTVSSQENEDNPEVMMEDLCSECHTEHSEGGGHLEGFFRLEHDEMVLCDHCHQPHEEDPPAAIDLCIECHHELSDLRHPQGGTGSCGICHRPHSSQPTGGDVCVTCHGQAEDVLVHNIPDHPNDCLVCHEPHFTTIEIRGVCSDCHEDMPDFAEGGQPAAHLDCANCHTLENFGYKGSYACAGCHTGPGAVLGNEDAPFQHKNCASCHPAHSWAAYGNCQSCHKDVSGVLAHELEFHPADNCRACHDAHLGTGMPASTDCMACHEDTGMLPGFGDDPPQLHLQCANCHTEDAMASGGFDFVGADSSCQLCHAEASAGVAWDDAPSGHTGCLDCHLAHSFAPAATEDSCALCHADVADTATNDFHADCANCHSGAHSFGFVGLESSCALCHSDAAGNAPNEYHADCSACHTMDHAFEYVGQESSCGRCHSQQVDEAPHEMHQACDTCHATDHAFGFVGAESSCELCHSGLGYEHATEGHADCSMCHTGHTFKASYDACKICHADKTEGHFEGFSCNFCHKFGEGGVFTEDMGLMVDRLNEKRGLK